MNDRIHATYRVRASRLSIGAVADALALEQSVELPAAIVRDPFVREHIVARVESIREIDDETHSVTIGIALETTGFDVAQTINMLFGNSSLHAHVELVDVDLPDVFVDRFAGPRFGIEGIRRLAAAHGRALTCAALKPQGLALDALASLCHTLAAAGIDVVKDDHGFADQSYAPFGQRVASCQRAIERAADATGRRALYAPSIVGGPTAIARYARIARDEGAAMILVAPALVGMPAFAELVATLDVPVLAHPAYAGAARVHPAWLLGRWFRLLGADAVIFPHHGGRFAYDEASCAALAGNARAQWNRIAPALPVPAGGLSVDNSADVVRFYGPDAMLLVGGSLLAAGDALEARTRELVERVRACAQEISPQPA